MLNSLIKLSGSISQKREILSVSLTAMLAILLLISQACVQKDNIYIVAGTGASKAELLSISHFKNDLENATGKAISVLSEDEVLPDKGWFYIVGTAATNSLIQGLAERKAIVLSEGFPGSRGGIWANVKLHGGQDAIVLAGSDVQGAQYALYDYCREVLEVDPYEYWTGNTTKPLKPLDLSISENKVISPPKIPILCYFENDVDELANIKEPLLEYDWESYTEMINSLVRLKYNAIQLFDMLGRPEFYQRQEYIDIRPDYNVRISFIDSLISYAQDMGMMVQIDLALGYEFKPMEQEKADCWRDNKEDWLAAWSYYFEETPLAKADIFILRPRNQVWDWEYISSCGEDKIEVFNEVYDELGELIDSYKPKAEKVVICYSDGMEMFNNGFNPPKDWIIAWADDGWGGFKILPNSTKGYDFGTYMHAGYWLNHTVHDPYPLKLDTIMKNMVREYQADKYCLVNGQQFRPFLLNIEAFSEIAKNPELFDGEQFYQDWTENYFGEEAAVYAVQAMKKLHEAQFNRVGYVVHLWEIGETLAYLSNSPIRRPGRTPIPYDYALVETDYDHVQQRLEILEQALEIAEEGAEIVSENEDFYHDYILLPINLYVDLLTFETTLHEMSRLKKMFEESGNKSDLEKIKPVLEKARKELDTINKRNIEGDINKKWEGWYDPAQRRPNNGFPTQEKLDAVEATLNSML